MVDNGQARVYLNDEPKNKINLNGPVYDAQMTLYIGSDDSGNYFSGLMDQLLIFNRALSHAEIIFILQASEPDGLPEIVTAPVGDTIFEGDTLNLSVDADGAPPLYYQWFRGETILRSQTSETLIIEYARTSDAGDYSVVVSNDAGEVKTTPTSVTITPITNISTGQVAYWDFHDNSGTTASDGSGTRHRQDTVFFSRGQSGSGNVAAFCVRRPQ